VIDACRGEHRRAGAHDLALAPHAHEHLALEHSVDLVGALVPVRLLHLARLEAVDVAEEVRRLEEIDLLHLGRIEPANVEALLLERHGEGDGNGRARGAHRAEERRKLIELTERCCVVYQTLRSSPKLPVSGTA